MMTFSETMFYAEAEGLLPTRAGRINAVINDIKKDPHPAIEFSDFEKILKNHGFEYNDLSDREIRYINARIS
jgi:hypothetical protein